jgi:hypothetical protein
MKRQTLSATLATIFCTAALLGFAPVLSANDHQGCTLRSVSGSYGYTVNGTRIGIGLASSVGVVNLGSDGTLTGSQTASFNGTILTETLTGTYEVGNDCRGSSVINVISSNPAYNRTSTLDIVWDDDTDKFRFIFTGDGQILTGDGQKMH